MTTMLSGAFAQGTLASRPAAASSNAGYYYFATDVNGGTLYQSTGSAWVQLAPGVSATGSGNVAVLQETILSVAAASITFASISGSYRTLLLDVVGASDAAVTFVNLNVEINGDTGANYDEQRSWGNNTTVSAFAAAATSTPSYGWLTGASAPAGVPGVVHLEFPDYSRTTWQKVIHGRSTVKTANSTSGTFVENVAGWWRNTAAITSILIKPDNGNFAAGTVAKLYGLT